MSDGPSSMNRAFQTFLERAPKQAGAWMTAVQALGEASALDQKTSALAYLAALAALRLDSGVPFSREARQTRGRVSGRGDQRAPRGAASGREWNHAIPAGGH